MEGHRPSATSPSSRRPSGAARWWRCSPRPCRRRYRSRHDHRARQVLREGPLHPAEASRAEGKVDGRWSRSSAPTCANRSRWWAISTRWRPATRSAGRRLIEMMDEFAIDDLDRLSAISSRNPEGPRSISSAGSSPAVQILDAGRRRRQADRSRRHHEDRRHRHRRRLRRRPASRPTASTCRSATGPTPRLA